MKNSYAGFIPPKDWKLSVVKMHQLKEFIDSRTPCIIDYCPEIDIDALSGNVQVETSKQGKFGQGIKIEMDFKDFLKECKSGNTSLYLTTQYEIEQQSLVKQFAAPPLDSIIDKLPKLWEIVDLIPHQMNLWMGCSNDTNSGLHHDFHDNIYMLLKGRKKIALFSPNDVDSMGLNGTVDCVFPNGLIQYEGDLVRSDGADLYDVAQYKVDLAERILETCPDDEKEQAEQNLEDALEELLQYTANDDLEDQEEEEEEAIETKEKKIKGESLIASFSKYQLDDPNLKGTRVDVVLNAGQSLYLPCGWFHHVTSLVGDDQMHAALNYWAIPPPQLDNFWKDKWSATLDAMKEQ